MASVDKADWQLGGNRDDFDPETSHPQKPCSQWILEVTGWKRVLLLNRGTRLQNEGVWKQAVVIRLRRRPFARVMRSTT